MIPRDNDRRPEPWRRECAAGGRRQVGSFLRYAVIRHEQEIRLTCVCETQVFPARDAGTSGKTTLFSCHLDGRHAVLAAAYRNAACIEDALRQWKGPHFVCW